MRFWSELDGRNDMDGLRARQCECGMRWQPQISIDFIINMCVRVIFLKQINVIPKKKTKSTSYELVGWSKLTCFSLLPLVCWFFKKLFGNKMRNALVCLMSHVSCAINYVYRIVLGGWACPSASKRTNAGVCDFKFQSFWHKSDVYLRVCALCTFCVSLSLFIFL